MSKLSRQRNENLKEGTRAFKRALANRHRTKKVLTGLAKYIAEKAADRPSHVSLFFSMWENDVAAVDAAAEEVLSHQRIDLPKKSWERLYEPYGFYQCVYFARLMDHLEPEEEARLAVLCGQLNGAWQKFFAATLVRHPELRELTERLAESRRIAHDEVVDLYTGEALPEFTPQWARAIQALEDGYRSFSEGLRK